MSTYAKLVVFRTGEDQGEWMGTNKFWALNIIFINYELGHVKQTPSRCAKNLC